MWMEANWSGKEMVPMKEIVIKIPDKLYEYIVKGKDLSEEQNDEMALAIADGEPLPEYHGDLIDRTKLYNQTSEWEAEALETVNKYVITDSPDEWRWWSAVLKERTAFKYDVADAPTVIKGD